MADITDPTQNVSLTNDDATLPVKIKTLNSENRLCVDALVPSTASITNNKVTTTSGVRVALAASTVVASVSIKALHTNKGSVFIGNSTVSSSNGYVLRANDTIDLDIDDLAKVYMDVSSNGEGITYIAVVN